MTRRKGVFRNFDTLARTARLRITCASLARSGATHLSGKLCLPQHVILNLLGHVSSELEHGHFSFQHYNKDYNKSIIMLQQRDTYKPIYVVLNVRTGWHALFEARF